MGERLPEPHRQDVVTGRFEHGTSNTELHVTLEETMSRPAATIEADRPVSAAARDRSGSRIESLLGESDDGAVDIGPETDVIRVVTTVDVSNRALSSQPRDDSRSRLSRGEGRRQRRFGSGLARSAGKTVTEIHGRHHLGCRNARTVPEVSN